MFPATPNDLDIGAMNQTDYADSAACGMCAQVTGPDGSITIRIVDRCPECKPGDIDFSPSAFAKLAAPSRGRVPIQWTTVPCTVSGPIVYHFKDGSNPWWTAVQIRNHRFGIARFEYHGREGFAAGTVVYRDRRRDSKQDNFAASGKDILAMALGTVRVSSSALPVQLHPWVAFSKTSNRAQ